MLIGISDSLSHNERTRAVFYISEMFPTGNVVYLQHSNVMLMICSFNEIEQGNYPTLPKHLSEMVVSEGEKPPLRLCRELLSEKKEPPKTKVTVEHPNMFEAHFIDSIWHADLHFPV
jgi:hypothetical protein